MVHFSSSSGQQLYVMEDSTKENAVQPVCWYITAVLNVVKLDIDNDTLI